MTYRRERTAEEKKAFQERMKRLAEFSRFAGPVDLNYEFLPVGAGEYRFMLTVDGRDFTAPGSLLADSWTRR